MTLRSPTSAMLWELWRVTRAEIAWRLALPIGVGVAALLLGAAFGPADNPASYQRLNDHVAAFALIIIVLPHFVRWLSMAKLNGSRPTTQRRSASASQWQLPPDRAGSPTCPSISVSTSAATDGA